LDGHYFVDLRIRFPYAFAAQQWRVIKQRRADADLQPTVREESPSG